MKIKLDLNKRDLLTIVVLSTVFFSLAVWNLGMTQTPITTAQFSSGQSFTVDLGSVNDVNSVNLLFKDGHFNITVSVGSPESWQVIASNILYPYNQGTWSGDYYKWYEITIQQTTQYIKLAFTESPSSVIISELAVINEDSQQISVASVSGVDSGNQNLSMLIDEQDTVQYPITYMTETYFDEIYFVKSAEQYLNLQVPYEWTHPPLGKLILASGIVAFGYNPFGWRIMGVIAATLMIPVIYILGKKLLGTWIGASAAAFLLAFDFMHFTMARMATADTYVVFFSLASQLFFLIYLKDVLKNGWNAPVQPLFWAFVFFALGFSTKWVVLYGFAAQLAILVVLRLREVAKVKKGWLDKLNTFSNHPYAMVLGFALVAVLIYFLTYIPDMLAGRSIIEVVNLQGSMYGYHSTLTATHAFSSPWWSWPLMLKPLWLSVSYLPSSAKSTIVLLGNPAVWWVGFACVIGISVFALVEIVKRGAKQLGKIGLPAIFIPVFFFFQWVPYVFISRVTFIYHFYVNVPFFCLASAYFISKYWSNRWVKVAAIACFAVTVAMFGLFYTVVSGIPASDSWIDSLKWFESWVF
ncbi:glycosyltransferase family 39 protein [Candidatus Bathyarchaeota archaeon]|nr:glycosyltransferase family 39 protein [Candidatus Bathyarchaeota archaeon]